MKRSLPKLSFRKRLLLSLPLAAILIFCLVQLGRYAWEGYQVQQESTSTASRYLLTPDIGEPVYVDSSGTEALPENPVDFAALQADSPWVVGWIQISGLEAVNYPLVFCGDNSYFLTHNWDGTYSRYGAIFVDASCASDLSDCYTLIYGHNMKNGTMFGTLKQYVDADFYQENGGIITICLPGQICTYQIFSVRYATPTDQEVYLTGFAHDDTFGAFLDNLVATSLYDTGVAVTAQDRVIALSTCSSSSRRLVVFAKLIDTVLTS